MSRISMPVRVDIIGVGSPAGDDRLGWEAVAALERSAAIHTAGVRVTLAALDRPGARLVAEIGAASRLILIDAVRSGATPGFIHRLRADQAALIGDALSSHGFGLAEALALAATLGCLPVHCMIFGVEAGATCGEQLSTPVQTALPVLVSMVEREVQMTHERDYGVEVQQVPCAVCLKEIPVSEAKSEEASDYVAYFCGLDCYSRWRQQDNKIAGGD